MSGTFPKVLVVDDDEPFARALARWLSELGYQPALASSAGQALELLTHDGVFDVVLLDLHLPDLDGHAILRWLKTSGISIPVIVVSGTTDMDDVVQAWRANAGDFLRKPFQLAELAVSLAKILPGCGVPDAAELPPSESSAEVPKGRLFGEAEDGLASRVLKARLLQQAGGGAPRAEWIRVGRYRVLQKAGQGGVGVVYLAFDEQLERKVALKLLRRDSNTAAASLLAEAKALARLSHPNVVQVHEVGEWGENFYLAMEYIEGRTLDRWVADAPSPEAILEVLVGAGRGLAAAHDRGIVHGDVKPGNVMVGDDGRPRMIDFGLARSVQHQAGSGVAEGTPDYMAPEQRRGESPTSRSDQYSFCLVARQFLPTVGGLDRGLADSPAERWPTMHALLAEFQLH